MKRLQVCKLPVVGVDLDTCDVTDAQSVLQTFEEVHPDAVIHCAAYTAVDKAETERELCERVNIIGTDNIAMACSEFGAKMLFLSTDYVFNGEGEQPYTTDDPCNPINFYGYCKRQAEERIQQSLDRYFIVRISWVFGHYGNNFVKTMLRLGKERESIMVVNDQIGSPTFTEDLATLLCDMVQTERYGIYHATNEGVCSWYDFAAAIMHEAHLPCAVLPISSESYRSAAKRPHNSRLAKDSLDAAGFLRLPRWEDALRRYLCNEPLV